MFGSCFPRIFVAFEWYVAQEQSFENDSSPFWPLADPLRSLKLSVYILLIVYRSNLAARTPTRRLQRHSMAIQFRTFPSPFCPFFVPFFWISQGLTYYHRYFLRQSSWSPLTHGLRAAARLNNFVSLPRLYRSRSKFSKLLSKKKWCDGL